MVDQSDRIDPEDRARDKPLCLRADADLPLLDAGAAEVECRFERGKTLLKRGPGRHRAPPGELDVSLR